MPSDHAIAVAILVVFYIGLLFATYWIGYRNGVQRFLEAYGLGGPEN